MSSNHYCSVIGILENAVDQRWKSGRVFWVGFGPVFGLNFPKRNRGQSGSIDGTLANNFFSFGLAITERRTLLSPETVEAIELLNSAYNSLIYLCVFVLFFSKQ